MYPNDFTVAGKKFVLSLYYNGDNSYLFVNGIQQAKFKAADTEILLNPVCLGNISKDPIPTGLNGYVYYFSIDCKAISNNRHSQVFNEKELHRIK